MLLYNNLIKFVYFLIYLIKIFNININNKIRFLSNIIQSNRVKGPRTESAPELIEFQKEVIFGLMLGDLTAEKTSLNGNTRLRFFMSNKYKNYMFHLYSIFKI
jgi:hypothetical protein